MTCRVPERPHKMVAYVVAATSPHLSRRPHERKATALEQVSWLTAQTHSFNLPGSVG